MTETDRSRIHVTAALIWKEGKVLVAQRPEGVHFQGLWEFPGGKQEEGETLESCLEREIAEELGMRVAAEEHLLTVRHRGEAGELYLHAFRCRWLGGGPQRLQCRAWEWVAPEELENGKDFPPPDRELIQALFPVRGCDGGTACFTRPRKRSTGPWPRGSK